MADASQVVRLKWKPTSALRKDDRALIKGYTNGSKVHAVDVEMNVRTFGHNYTSRAALCGVKVNVSPVPYTAETMVHYNRCKRCGTRAMATYQTITEAEPM